MISGGINPRITNPGCLLWCPHPPKVNDFAGDLNKLNNLGPTLQLADLIKFHVGIQQPKLGHIFKNVDVKKEKTHDVQQI